MEKRESLNRTWTLISTFVWFLEVRVDHTRDRLIGSNKPRNAVERRFLGRLFEAFQFNSI